MKVPSDTKVNEIIVQEIIEKSTSSVTPPHPSTISSEYTNFIAINKKTEAGAKGGRRRGLTRTAKSRRQTQKRLQRKPNTKTKTKGKTHKKVSKHQTHKHKK